MSSLPRRDMCYCLCVPLCRTNGQRVLRVLLSASKRSLCSHAPPPSNVLSHELAQLPFTLPWLPAYDRRDALVIQEVLRLLLAKAAFPAASDAAPDSSQPRPPQEALRRRRSVDAAAFEPEVMAFCLYVSAKGSQPPKASGAVFAKNFPAPTGDFVGSSSPRAWLAEKQLSVEVRSQSGWYDATAPTAATPPETVLTPAALKRWGIRLVPGRTFALAAPNGLLLLAPPSFGQWSLHSLSPIPQRTQLRQLILIFFVIFVLAVVATLAFILRGPSIEGIVQQMSSQSGVILYCSLIALACVPPTASLINTCRFDAHVYRAHGAMPLRLNPWSPLTTLIFSSCLLTLECLLTWWVLPILHTAGEEYQHIIPAGYGVVPCLGVNLELFLRSTFVQAYFVVGLAPCCMLWTLGSCLQKLGVEALWMLWLTVNHPRFVPSNVLFLLRCCRSSVAPSIELCSDQSPSTVSGST